MKKKIFKVMSLSAFVLIFVLIGLRESKGMASSYNCEKMRNACYEILKGQYKDFALCPEFFNNGDYRQTPALFFFCNQQYKQNIRGKELCNAVVQYAKDTPKSIVDSSKICTDK